MRLSFQCNICAADSSWTDRVLEREAASCDSCGSTRRMREVAYLTTLGLFGVPLPLAWVPVRKDLRGLGLSDCGGYVPLMEDRLDYQNTWYHQEPRLDVTAVPDDMVGRYDLVISSDVFEHVLPPVQAAFDGVAKLLLPGGVLVLTVPCTPSGATQEHYPGAVGYDVVALDDRYVVDISEADGSVRRVEDPIFHGGPGSTLEMRLFGLDAIKRHLRSAGFSAVRVLRQDVPENGIVRRSMFSLPLLAYR